MLLILCQSLRNLTHKNLARLKKKSRHLVINKILAINIYLIVYLFFYILIVAINSIIDKWTVGVKEKRYKFH